MATKTITLEIDAYEKLRRAKHSPRESFSSVVRRATWNEEPLTAGRLLDHVREVMMYPEKAIPDAILDSLDRAQAESRVSDSHW
jgi:hypothetical protein